MSHGTLFLQTANDDMTLRFSNDVMKAMGFRAFMEGEEIAAAFTSVTVFEARGVALATGMTVVSDGTVTGVDYRLAVSPSVNDGCIALLNNAFVEDEDQWKKEEKCQGPFVLVQIGPTAELRCSSGSIKIEDNDDITTYDSFPNVRVELAQLEGRVLPPILSALTCVLNEEAHYVKLRKISRASVGRTPSGDVVYDVRMEGRMELCTAYKLEQSQLTEKLELATALASTLNQKASRFFALGLAEEDQLKRFLYFFLALEVETHAVFSHIDHPAALKKLFGGAASSGEATTKLIQNQVKSLKNLYDRFVWCAACAWPKLGDDDIAQFKKLKSARDDIAHGSASEPPPGFARLAELLAHKVLWRTK